MAAKFLRIAVSALALTVSFASVDFMSSGRLVAAAQAQSLGPVEAQAEARRLLAQMSAPTSAEAAAQQIAELINAITNDGANIERGAAAQAILAEYLAQFASEETAAAEFIGAALSGAVSPGGSLQGLAGSQNIAGVAVVAVSIWSASLGATGRSVPVAFLNGAGAGSPIGMVASNPAAVNQALNAVNQAMTSAGFVGTATTTQLVLMPSETSVVGVCLDDAGNRLPSCN